MLWMRDISGIESTIFINVFLLVCQLTCENKEKNTRQTNSYNERKYIINLLLKIGKKY